MSEVASRPSASRGRGSGRGGRGGFAGRGGRRTNGDKTDAHATQDSASAFDDEGDIGELRRLYGDKTSVIREMFPDWSEVDVLFALQETNGDQTEAVTRIAEGNISQWGEVSKPKKPVRSKVKDTPGVSSESTSAPRSSRGGRNATEGGRGRGRATERGGRGGRGRSSQPTANGPRSTKELSVPTEESTAFSKDEAAADAAEEKNEPSHETTAAPVPEPTKSAAPQAKTWASMLRQSTAPKPAPIPREIPASAPPAELQAEPEPAIEAAAPIPEPEPVTIEEDPIPVVETAAPDADIPPAVLIEPEIALRPSHDELTKTNLEQVADESKPPATQTAASTTADSWDPRQNPPSTNATPLSAAQHQHQAQRQTSGYATSAIKATAERAVRTPSYQRRVLDQEEAVRLPGNREVDRAAVQFGAFNLSGGDDDVDGEREDPETRAQPPADSPISHPRTSLPPVSQPVSGSDHKALPTGPSAAVPQAPAAQATTTGPAATQPPPNQQFGRYGQAGAQEASAGSQKPLDPFHPQNTASSQPPFDAFPAHSQPQSQQPGAPYSSAPSDYPSYYTANDRTPYNYYGQQFGQQGAQGQENLPGQRPFGGYNPSQQTDNLSQYPQSGAAVHNQPRFGAGSNEAQNSGHSTPNPTSQAQQAQQQAQQQAAQQAAQQQQPQQGAPGSQTQSHGQQQGFTGYNPQYYSSPYYPQYYAGYGQGGFGPYGKGGMYGQPYGVTPNAPFDHANSPASFAQTSAHRDSALGSGLGEYGRGASAQTGGAPGLTGSGFSSVHDSFARGSSTFQSQGQAYSSQAQQGNGAASDDLKPFGESKSGAGPSPSMGGARPGSATTTASNNAPAGQSGLPPPPTSQMGAGAYAGYPSHLQGHGLHGSSGYGMGGAAAGNQHGSTPYGNYGQGGFGSGGYYGGQQQQRGGWGGNYH